MSVLRPLSVIACLALGAAWPITQAKAADTAASAARPSQTQNRYRIEMVFFTLNSPGNFQQEDWRQGEPRPDLAKALNLFGGQSAPGFKALPPADYQLDKAVKRLQASGRYTVIGHIAWEQPGLDIQHAIPIVIRMGAHYGPLYPQLMQPQSIMRGGQTVEVPAARQLYQLHGTVKVVLSRYLHLYTNLVLRVPTKPEQPPAAVSSPPATPTRPDANTNLPFAATATTPTVQPTRQIEDLPVIANPRHATPAADATLTEVHIIEHRRTRSRKLNYIDHPLLGILFEIWPVGHSR